MSTYHLILRGRKSHLKIATFFASKQFCSLYYGHRRIDEQNLIYITYCPKGGPFCLTKGRTFTFIDFLRESLAEKTTQQFFFKICVLNEWVSCKKSYLWRRKFILVVVHRWMKAYRCNRKKSSQHFFSEWLELYKNVVNVLPASKNESDQNWPQTTV